MWTKEQETMANAPMAGAVALGYSGLVWFTLSNPDGNEPNQALPNAYRWEKDHTVYIGEPEETVRYAAIGQAKFVGWSAEGYRVFRTPDGKPFVYQQAENIFGRPVSQILPYTGKVLSRQP